MVRYPKIIISHAYIRSRYMYGTTELATATIAIAAKLHCPPKATRLTRVYYMTYLTRDQIMLIHLSHIKSCGINKSGRSDQKLWGLGVA